MRISILLSTYKRTDLLTQELESFCKNRIDGFHFEILVVDNADDPGTKKIVESFKECLPIKYFVETKPGKNAALNRIIPEAQGDVFVFTDDDIVADKEWLNKIYSGVQRFQECSIFGGKIFPFNPEIIPEQFRKLKRYMHIYGIADWGNEDKGIPADDIYGTNMIVRAELFRRGYRFREDVGPKGTDYVPGSETEFLKRMQALGYKSMYLHRVVVYHQIRPEQCDFKWVLKRAFRDGRARTWFNENFALPLVFGVPRYLYRAIVEKFFYVFFCRIFKRDEYFEQRYKLESLKGAFYQYWKQKNSITNKDL